MPQIRPPRMMVTIPAMTNTAAISHRSVYMCCGFPSGRTSQTNRRHTAGPAKHVCIVMCACGTTGPPAKGSTAVGHDHGVRPVASTGARYRARLLAVLVLLAVVMLLEIAAAWWTGSLALLSDGGHMLTDVLGIGMALAAIQAAAAWPVGTSRPGGGTQRTFGLYRLEVLAALGNAVLLFGVAGYVLVEAIRRFADPPEVRSGPMLVVATVGLAANVAGFLLLHSGAKQSLN